MDFEIDFRGTSYRIGNEYMVWGRTLGEVELYFNTQEEVTKQQILNKKGIVDKKMAIVDANKDIIYELISEKIDDKITDMQVMRVCVEFRKDETVTEIYINASGMYDKYTPHVSLYDDETFECWGVISL